MVHSKKVCLSPSCLILGLVAGRWWWMGVGLEPWSQLTPFLFLPPQGGDGFVDTESKFLKLVAAIKAALAQAGVP